MNKKSRKVSIIRYKDVETTQWGSVSTLYHDVEQTSDGQNVVYCDTEKPSDGLISTTYCDIEQVSNASMLLT